MAKVRIKSIAFPERPAMDIEESTWKQMQVQQKGEIAPASAKFRVIEQQPKVEKPVEPPQTKVLPNK